MVNKPQALYREDAERAFERDRKVLLDEIRRRMEEARASVSTLDCDSSTDLTLLRHRQTQHSMTRTSVTPRTLTATLDTGFTFQCLISDTESGSFISQRLYQQIQPRPIMTPIRAGAHGERLRFNGMYYRALGYITFAMKLASPDDDSKLVEILITASVVPALTPDLFLGKEQRSDMLVPYTQ